MASENNIKTTVLMTADTIGGVWSYCIDLMNIMADNNFYFHLVTAGAPLNSEQKNQLNELDNVTVHETAFKLEWMNDPWHDIDYSGSQLIELERRLKPDLIHLNSYSYASLPFKAPVIVAAHSDVYSWWFSVRKSVPGGEWQEYFRRVKEGIRNADRVVAPSHHMMNMLSAVFGPVNDTRVIYNGRNEKLFKAAEKKPYLMCAGRLWDEAKNLKLIAAAAPYIKAEIRLAGEINSGLCFDDNIKVLGKLGTRQLAAELANAAVFVAPAKYEPFGLSILEAAISGCALVLGDIPSLRELWQDNAIYVDTDNAEALARTCNELISNGALMQEYARKARQRSERFSLALAGKNYTDLYEELLKTGKEAHTFQLA